MLFNYYFQGFLKQTVFRSFQTEIIYEDQFKINHNLKDKLKRKRQNDSIKRKKIRWIFFKKKGQLINLETSRSNSLPNMSLRLTY
jgi:hypothetical protein